MAIIFFLSKFLIKAPKGYEELLQTWYTSLKDVQSRVVTAQKMGKKKEEMNPFMKAMLESIITNTANSKQLAQQREAVLKDTFEL